MEIEAISQVRNVSATSKSALSAESPIPTAFPEPASGAASQSGLEAAIVSGLKNIEQITAKTKPGSSSFVQLMLHEGDIAGARRATAFESFQDSISARLMTLHLVQQGGTAAQKCVTDLNRAASS
jgi:hypothetical protein